MPAWLHIILAIVITAYFLFRYIKDKQIYELIFLIWVPSTLLQYLSDNTTFLRCLGVFELIMLFLAVFFMFRRRGAARHKTAQILADFATGDLDKVMATRLPKSEDNSKEITKENIEKTDSN